MERERASHAAAFGGAAAVVRDGRYVLDERNFQPDALQCADRSFATGARAFYKYFHSA